MKILWIPQIATSSHAWDGSRHYHLLRRLSREHDIHLVTWEHIKSAAAITQFGRRSNRPSTFGTEHSITLAPSVYRLVTREYPPHFCLRPNQFIFQKAVSKLLDTLSPDVCVYSASHHATGFPPPANVPVVFEYLDFSPAWVAEYYLRHSQAVVAVSDRLAKDSRRLQEHTYVIPNGVDVQRYQTITREEAKRRIGLSGKTVISLIGLTCSRTLYFLDAIASLSQKRPDLVFLYLGAGETADAIADRARQLRMTNTISPGAVPNSEVHVYFAASDIGLYPGDDTAYYRGASPLKVVEYSAAGAQVISSPVDLFETGWPNVRISRPDAASFEQALAEALEHPRTHTGIHRYDWTRLSEEFDSVLHSVVPARQQRTCV